MDFLLRRIAIANWVGWGGSRFAVSLFLSPAGQGGLTELQALAGLKRSPPLLQENTSVEEQWGRMAKE